MNSNKLSVVIATVNSNEVNSIDKKYDIAYNRINNAFDIQNCLDIVNSSYLDIQKTISYQGGFEIKEWGNDGVVYYSYDITDCKGKPNKLRHNQNSDGTYFKVESITIKELMDITNTQYVFIKTPNEKVYYYDGMYFGEFFETEGIIEVNSISE